MDQSEREQRPAPALSAGHWLTLREKLAARVNGAAAAVAPGHFVSGYYAEDPMDRGRLLEMLERTFRVTLDIESFEAAKTVGDLAGLIAVRLAASRRESGRTYIVVYRNRDGQTVETHVRAANHEEAIESLRAEGLEQALSVQRADDEDLDDRRYRGTGRAVRGHLLPILVVVLGALAAVAYFWFKYR